MKLAFTCPIIPKLQSFSHQLFVKPQYLGKTL